VELVFLLDHVQVHGFLCFTASPVFVAILLDETPEFASLLLIACSSSFGLARGESLQDALLTVPSIQFVQTLHVVQC